MTRKTVSIVLVMLAGGVLAGGVGGTCRGGGDSGESPGASESVETTRSNHEGAAGEGLSQGAANSAALRQGPEAGKVRGPGDTGGSKAEKEPREARNSDAGGASPPEVQCLREGYPDAINGVQRRDGDIVVSVGADTTLVWDDGRDKSYEERFRNPDLEDLYFEPYRTGPPDDDPGRDEDPGRVRSTALFKAVYGATAREVRTNIVQVDWPGRGKDTELAFNRKNGAAEALRQVAAKLRALPDRFDKYFETTAGTFNWRNIAGTDQRSAHSFAIAVDLNTDYANYWRWSDMEHPVAYENRMPFEVVEAFEAHGFVWGGKWYRYDTMHFEYRPELVGCSAWP